MVQSNLTSFLSEHLERRVRFHSFSLQYLVLLISVIEEAFPALLLWHP